MDTSKLLFAALLSFGSALVSYAYEFERGGVYYNIKSASDLTVEVTFKNKDYMNASNSYTGDVEIPPTVQYNGKLWRVAAIAKRAFTKCPDLVSVDTGDGVELIDEYAFVNSGIRTLYIGRNVKRIGTYAFNHCDNLKDIYIEDVTAWSGINANFYWGCPLGPTGDDTDPTKTLYLNGQKISGGIVINEGITSISNYAFYGCTGLTSVQLSKGLSIIGRYAFSGCSNITQINIPDGVATLDQYAFENCSSLTELILPNSLQSIENGAMLGCSGLSHIYIPDNVTRIGKYALQYCNGLKEIVIGSNVTVIDDYAFQHCKNLKTMRIFATVPPTCSYESPFDDKLFSVSTLYVPRGCKSAYTNADVWALFNNIVEMDNTNVEDMADSPKANAPMYNLQGVRILQHPESGGVFIQNGKKVLSIPTK